MSYSPFSRSNQSPAERLMQFVPLIGCVLIAAVTGIVGLFAIMGSRRKYDSIETSKSASGVASVETAAAMGDKGSMPSN